MKTSELSGVQLDWAVAKAEGVTCAPYKSVVVDEGCNPLMYHDDWGLAGPIIQRERIRLDPRGVWVAGHDSSNDEYLGATPLIAAMRCYVASKLGEEVEIPKEITHENKLVD